ncbi:MAG: tetratricopeptide repeat protein [Chloroflexi bacterium]|nr:tetratricopeptide repeat protein [Chloroflexota bacterium]
MTVLTTHSQTELEARKALGRAHLEANRVEDALRVYASILSEYPGDIDSYIFLGDCYLAEGSAETALVIYTQALEYAGDHPEVLRRIRLAKNECHQGQSRQVAADISQILDREAAPADPAALAGLLQKITAPDSRITEEDVIKAARLLEQIVNSREPARAVAERLQEIDSLVPALLELNIRQARLDGRPDLAAALTHLLENIYLQMDTPQPGQRAASQKAAPAALKLTRVLLLDGCPDMPANPIQAAAGQLAAAGWLPQVARQFPFQELAQFDAVVAYCPHVDEKLMEGLALCVGEKKPLMLYLDMDYEQMPVDHPRYESCGISNPGRAKAYYAALLLADLICTSNGALAAEMRSRGYRAQVIPEGMPGPAKEWEKPVASRPVLRIGWTGSQGQLDDVFQVRRMIVRVLREFPQAQLVIVGDAQVYQLFDSLSESRRMYLPAIGAEDYPYLLSQMDIVIAPLRNTPFNNLLSDRPLLEAGMQGIPWVASPTPAYLEWREGGLIANTPDEWHTHLRQLVLDANVRATLGWTGGQKARQRSASQLGALWADAIQRLLTG